MPPLVAVALPERSSVPGPFRPCGAKGARVGGSCMDSVLRSRLPLARDWAPCLSGAQSLALPELRSGKGRGKAPGKQNNMALTLPRDWAPPRLLLAPLRGAKGKARDWVGPCLLSGAKHLGAPPPATQATRLI